MTQASKSNDGGIGIEVVDMLHNMSTIDKDKSKDGVSSNICANCGKEGSDITNTCNKLCKQVKYSMPHVKRNIDTNIRKIVKNISDLLLSVQLSYMMNNSL